MEDAILLDDNMFLWDMESLDRLDGIPADLMRRDDDSDDPQQQQQSGSVSNLSAWHRLPTPPPPPTMPNGRTTDMESVWERDLSSAGFRFLESPSRQSPPMMPPGGAEEMDHSYASVDLPPATAAANRVPSPFQFFDLMDDMDSLIGVRGDEDDVSSLESSAETWGDAGASSGSSHHHHPALSSSTTTTTTSTSTLAASGMSMNEESNTNHSQTGSEWSGSNSAVASVTSDYQHAPLSPEPLGELFRPESPPQERLARHATAQVHLPTGFTLTSEHRPRRPSPPPRPPRDSSPEIPYPGWNGVSVPSWLSIARRSVIARPPPPTESSTHPAAPASPPTMPSRFSIISALRHSVRHSGSTGTGGPAAATPRTPVRRSNLGHGVTYTTFPRFFEAHGNVTLSGVFPPPAATVKVEDLTQVTRKRISPQVRKVMGKLGVEFGDDARSSRAMTPDPCSICFELPTIKNASLAYPCLHAFCDPCISEWVKTKSSCPNCQASCTKILYNLRAELDYDSKDVQNRNTLAHPAAYDGDLLQFFIHMNHRRANADNPQSTATFLSRSLIGRGNPYLSQAPIRESYQVAALYSRSFPDIPSATEQERLLPRHFEVSRVSFRRRVYAEPLNGAVEAQSVPAPFVAPSEIGPSITADQGFLARFMPWLRREVMAVLVPEANTAQREMLYQVILGLFRDSRTVLRSAFVAQVSDFIAPARVEKFWEQMVLFVRHRFATGVWDESMAYFTAEGTHVPATTRRLRNPGPLRPSSDSRVQLVNMNLYSDSDAEPVAATPAATSAASTPLSPTPTVPRFPVNQDPDDSDDSVQFISAHQPVRTRRPVRRPVLVVLSSDDEDAVTTNSVSTPQTANTAPELQPPANSLWSPPRSPRTTNIMCITPPTMYHDAPMSPDFQPALTPERRRSEHDSWSDDGGMDSPARATSWDRGSGQRIRETLRALAAPTSSSVTTHADEQRGLLHRRSGSRTRRRTHRADRGGEEWLPTASSSASSSSRRRRLMRDDSPPPSECPRRNNTATQWRADEDDDELGRERRRMREDCHRRRHGRDSHRRHRASRRYRDAEEAAGASCGPRSSHKRPATAAPRH